MPDSLAYDMLDLAARLANEAAAIALPRLGRTVATKKADGSLVTDVDHAIQDGIVDAIGKAYPDHAVCAEETLQPLDHRPSPNDARYCWVIDPLDGTRNYASGLPCFATSIAVLDNRAPIVGVVLEHNLNHLYTAVSGGGAKLNNAPIHVEELPVHTDTLVGIPSSKDPMTVSVLCGWVATKGLVLRNLGSTALHLAMVASGALDAVFCKQCKIWDIAAGALLISEAGGRLTDPFGETRIPFDLSVDPNADLPTLAAPPEVHKRLQESIRAHAR